MIDRLLAFVPGLFHRSVYARKENALAKSAQERFYWAGHVQVAAHRLRKKSSKKEKKQKDKKRKDSPPSAPSS